MLRKYLRELGEQWVVFLCSVLNPIVFMLLCVVVALMIGSFITTQVTSPTASSTTTSGMLLSALLTVLLTVSSGLLGSRIWQRWSDLTGKGVLVTRGKSAVRGLKLLLLNVAALQERTNLYIKRLDPQTTNYALINHTYEEIVERCLSLQEETMNSIEEWVDIIPDADVKTKIGSIENLRDSEADLINEISTLERELVTAQEKGEQGEEERKRLQLDLDGKEKELHKVREELKSAQAKINSSVLSGVSALTGPAGIVGSVLGGGQVHAIDPRSGRGAAYYQPASMGYTMGNPSGPLHPADEPQEGQEGQSRPN